MNPTEIFDKKVIVAVLNWGNGHLARSIGLIQQLLSQNNSITIAASEEQEFIYRNYFPDVAYLRLLPYPFEFSGNGNFSKDLWNSRIKLKQHLVNESKWVEEIVSNHPFDVLISDHRYGFRSDKVHSIFVTHQLNLPLKWWQFPVKWLHGKLIKSFNEIWVLDDSNSTLAGNLSRNTGFKNVNYIGWYSRFMFSSENKGNPSGELVICNGPSPYDEQLLLRYLRDETKTIIASKKLAEKYPSNQIYSSENWKVCDSMIQNATKIYSYCGYTTLMDLHYLKCEHKLIPTKGQAEQEYLFKLHNLKK